ncbi:MAG: hypothetical protein VX777_01720 [Chlamydiota bacterium]|nr:hypothetical protein [Chlamydiota bacterium]
MTVSNIVKAPECPICFETLLIAGRLNCEAAHTIDYECAETLFKKWREGNQNEGPCPECRGKVTSWTYDREYSKLVSSIAGEELQIPPEKKLELTPAIKSKEKVEQVVQRQPHVHSYVSNEEINIPAYGNDVYTSVSNAEINLPGFGNNVHAFVSNVIGSAFGGANYSSGGNVFVSRGNTSSGGRNHGDINKPGELVNLAGIDNATNIKANVVNMSGASRCNNIEATEMAVISGAVQVACNINAPDVSISGAAKVLRNVIATNVSISGAANITGEIFATEVTLSGHAKCFGTIHADRLILIGNNVGCRSTDRNTQIIRR